MHTDIITTISHNAVFYSQTNPNLLSLIGGEHLLYVLKVKNLESSEVINVIPDGAIDIILDTGE